MLPAIFKAIGVTLALAVFVAGCGGGDDSTSSLTKAQFIKQADAICKQADEDQVAGLARVEKQLTGKTTGPEADPKNQETLILEGGLPPIKKSAEEISALGAPSGDEDEVDAYVEALETSVAKAEEEPLGPLTTIFEAPDKAAAKYGMKECAETL